jgi:hypothetical protein
VKDWPSRVDATRNPQSAIRNPQSAMNVQSTFVNGRPQSKIVIRQSSLKHALAR